MDFGATLDLRAMETDNSSVDNHAVICIFFVLTGWRNVDFYNSESETMDKTIVSNCNKWIVFGDTISKGKKNDHVFHNACLSYLVKFYDKELEIQNKPPIANKIIHTDNCPTQYKCRQNFLRLASAGESHPTRFIHKFPQKFGFKGPWDATGKLIKSTILRNELRLNRCANALDCYYQLKRDLNKDGTNEVNDR